MSKEKFQIGAYHEAGHAIIGYYMGFQIDAITLLENDPGSGFTKFDYGKDNLVIAGILNAIKEPAIFNSLSRQIRLRTPQALTKICCTLVGGPVAEAIHKNGIDYNGLLDIGFKDPDAAGIEACEYVISIIDKTKSGSYIKDCIYNTTSLIRSKEYWDIITKLVNTILSSETKVLTKEEVETIFDENNFKRLNEN